MFSSILFTEPSQYIFKLEITKLKENIMINVKDEIMNVKEEMILLRTDKIEK